MFFNFQECFYYFDCHFMQTLLEIYQHQIKMLVNFLNFFTQDWYLYISFLIVRKNLLKDDDTFVKLMQYIFLLIFNISSTPPTIPPPYHCSSLSLFFTKIFTYPCYSSAPTIRNQYTTNKFLFLISHHISKYHDMILLGRNSHLPSTQSRFAYNVFKIVTIYHKMTSPSSLQGNIGLTTLI